jgi:tRNA dimethylallyltransferase
MLYNNTIIPRNNTEVPILIVICGPTGTGKSGLAIALAQRLNTPILSADSRQVYREFNIGTAKPSAFEQQQVPHYLIDICDPTETLTLAEYQQQAQGLIERGVRSQESGGKGGKGDKGDKGDRQEASPSSPSSPSPLSPPSLLLVGGTGLYIRAITKGMKIPRVPPQPELRSQLQALGQPQCYAMLRQMDPASAEKIHPNDQVRTLRSLEVFYVTGHPISEQQGEDPPTYPILQIGLDAVDADALGRRIAKRTGQMVEAGLVAEVESLCQKYGAELPLLNTLGYAEFKQYLAGDFSLAQAEAMTVLHTRQFAKRQRTWFRAYPEIAWFDCDRPDLLDAVWQKILEFTQS